MKNPSTPWGALGVLLLLGMAVQAAPSKDALLQDDPLGVNLEIDPRGTFSRQEGTVTLSGTLFCTEPAQATVSGDITQQAGRVTLRETFSVEFLCDGVTPWSVTITPASGRFAGGPAEVFASGLATTLDGTSSSFEFESRTVLLQGSR